MSPRMPQIWFAELVSPLQKPSWKSTFFACHEVYVRHVVHIMRIAGSQRNPAKADWFLHVMFARPAPVHDAFK